VTETTDDYEDECVECGHCRAGHFDDGSECLISVCECPKFADELTDEEWCPFAAALGIETDR
jgi:hypothetical protein